jgi:hypothetical protein
MFFSIASPLRSFLLPPFTPSSAPQETNEIEERKTNEATASDGANNRADQSSAIKGVGFGRGCFRGSRDRRGIALWDFVLLLEEVLIVCSI